MLETTLNPFPPGTPDYVTHDVLKDYIQDTAVKTGVHELTRYNTEVKRLIKNGSKWTVNAVTLRWDSPESVLREEYSSVSHWFRMLAFH